MRAVRFLPLTFLAGVDGFAVYAPYATAFVVLTHVLWAVKRAKAGRLPAVI